MYDINEQFKDDYIKGIDNIEIIHMVNIYIYIYIYIYIKVI